jgi:hypothetical protein
VYTLSVYGVKKNNVTTPLSNSSTYIATSSWSSDEWKFIIGDAAIVKANGQSELFLHVDSTGEMSPNLK